MDLVVAFLLLFNYALAIRPKQTFEVFYLFANLESLVGVGYEQPVSRQLHQLCGALDVGTVADGIGSALKGLVLYQLKPARMEYESVASDACGSMISLCEASVYHHQAPFCLYWAFAACRTHGNVSVDDVPVGTLYAEVVEKHVADLR